MFFQISFARKKRCQQDQSIRDSNNMRKNAGIQNHAPPVSALVNIHFPSQNSLQLCPVL
jgi:hypothetical protein